MPLVDLSGLPVNRCPEWTATVDLNYTIPMGGLSGRVVLDASANYVPRNLDTYSIALPYAPFTQTYADSRTLINASITYTSAQDRWFVRVLDATSATRPTSCPRRTSTRCGCGPFYGEPRYIGGEVGLKFGS